MATKKSKAKTTPKKAKAPAKVVPTAATVITFKAQRTKTGTKTDLLALVPKKGSITLKELAAKAEKEGIKSAKVPKWVAFLAHYGYVELKGV